MAGETGLFVGAAQASGRLYNLGSFPGMVEPDGPDQWVVGDLFELPGGERTLHELDHYESSHYDRQCAEVTLTDGNRAEVWLYWYRGQIDEAKRIPSGDYFT